MGHLLLTRETCGPPNIATFPSSVTLLLGGALGYSPHTEDSIADMLRAAGAHHTHMVAIGARQQHASSILAKLLPMDAEGA